MTNELSHSARCWRCKRTWDECQGTCVPEKYVPQTDKKSDAIAELERAIGSTVAEISLLEARKARYISELNRLKNPHPTVDTSPKGWIKVGQSVPCWKCKRPTEWRNPNSAPEHKNGNCPNMKGGMTFSLASYMDGLLNGTRDADEFLRDTVDINALRKDKK